MLSILKNANLALAFLLELCMLAALCYWGFSLDKGWLVKIGLGIGAPLLVAVIWGLFQAPRASWPLPEPWHLILAVVLFGSAMVALYTSGQHTLSIIFAIVYIISTTLVYIWRQ